MTAGGRGSILALALAAAMAPADADEVAFDHVSVVDVVEGRLAPDRLVRGLRSC